MQHDSFEPRKSISLCLQRHKNFNNAIQFLKNFGFVEQKNTAKHFTDDAQEEIQVNKSMMGEYKF